MTSAELLSAGVPGPAGWILYDDSCGVCRRWVPFWEESLRKRGFDVAPLQADWVAFRLNMDGSEIVSDLRLLFADGSHIRGADVYRYAMKKIWWASPLYLFSVLPLFGAFFDWSYRTFALHRHLVSRVCGLPGAGD